MIVRAALLAVLAMTCSCRKPETMRAATEDAGASDASRDASSATSSVVDAGPALAPSSAPRLHLDLDDDAAHGRVSARRWLSTHGVAPDPIVDRVYACFTAQLGVPARDGLVCEQGGPMKGSLDSGESLFPLTLYVVDGKKLREVLEVPIAAGPLDREAPPDPKDPKRGQYVRLEAVVAPSGARVDVRELTDATANCAASLAAVPKDAPRIARMVRVACASVGVYTWDGSRFTKAR